MGVNHVLPLTKKEIEEISKKFKRTEKEQQKEKEKKPIETSRT
jgi:hypothetical protein